MDYFETILLDISTSELLGVAPKAESKEAITIYNKIFQYLRDDVCVNVCKNNDTFIQYHYTKDTRTISFHIHYHTLEAFKLDNIMSYLHHRFAELDLIIVLRNYTLNTHKMKFIYL